MSTLKITLLQQPLVWRDGLANLAAFDALLAPIAGRDLIVLPEMFTTGFAMDAGESALPEQQVIDFVAGQVAPHKKVREVEFIDAIPKSAAGKILRKDLRRATGD